MHLELLPRTYRENWLGIVELITGILLLIPKTVWAGSLLTLAVISGAIFMHLTQLGIEVKGDGGALFIAVIVTFILSAVILLIYKKNIPYLRSFATN